MRRFLAVLAAAVLLPGAAACQNVPDPYTACTPPSTGTPTAHWRLL